MFKLQNKIGRIGEDTAVMFLMKQGFEIIERNYWKKWGEIDIVARKDGILHFVEVKAVSCENLEMAFESTDKHNPEDNIHPWKIKRLHRVVQTYLMEYEEKQGSETDWQTDILAVFLDTDKRQAKIRMFSDVVL